MVTTVDFSIISDLETGLNINGCLTTKLRNRTSKTTCLVVRRVKSYFHLLLKQVIFFPSK